MRNLIRKVLLENDNVADVEIGDIYHVPNNGHLLQITQSEFDGIVEPRSVNTGSWGTVNYNHLGTKIKYKVSDDEGKTWYYEDVSEDGEEGHWVSTQWIKILLEKGWWVLLQKNTNFFDSINESEEDFDWAEKAIKDIPSIELGQKVIVTNKGSYFPTNTTAMLDLGIPGMKEFLDTYGKHWWHHVPPEHGGAERIDGWEDWLIHKVPALGKPKNDDVCYIIGEPLKGKGTDPLDWIYRLYRESDGKQFIMHSYGFTPVENETIKESEDDLGWAEELVSNQKDYINVKWIRTNDGKRFKNMEDRDEARGGDVKPWSQFRGWDNWFGVEDVLLIDGVLCYITALQGQLPPPHRKYDKKWIYSHQNYMTPVEEYSYNEISFEEKRPKRV